MSEEDGNEKPSSKAKETLSELRIKELMEFPKETLAKLVCEQEIEYATLTKDNKSLLKQNEKLQEEIEALKNKDKSINKYDGYDKSKELLEKIIFILKRNTDAMTFIEVKDTLLLLEPELKYRWGNVNKSVTYLLSKGCNLGVLVKSKKWGHKGNFIYQVAE